MLADIVFNLNVFSAPPNCGLSSQQMAGKKSSKNHITAVFMCNSTGTQKLQIFFIGKSTQPCRFGKTTQKDGGFYYWNKKTAWMASTTGISAFRPGRKAPSNCLTKSPARPTLGRKTFQAKWCLRSPLPGAFEPI